MNDCKLSFICSRTWDSLQQGPVDGVRHCDSCSTQVHAVRSFSDFDQQRELGNCVALLFDVDMAAATVGMIDIPYNAGPNFDPILGRPTQELELPPGFGPRLESSGLTRIGDLVQASEESLATIPGMSPEAIAEVKDCLASHGLELGTNLDGWEGTLPAG